MTNEETLKVIGERLKDYSKRTNISKGDYLSLKDSINKAINDILKKVDEKELEDCVKKIERLSRERKYYLRWLNDNVMCDISCPYRTKKHIDCYCTKGSEECIKRLLDYFSHNVIDEVDTDTQKLPDNVVKEIESLEQRYKEYCEDVED